MAGTDRVIDPITRDYVQDGAGNWKLTSTIATSLLHQLVGQRTQWWGDPDAGSDFYLFQRAKDNDATMTRLIESTKAAFKPFLRDGLASDAVVQVDRNQVGKRVLRSSIKDTQHGEVIDISPLIPYGA